MFRPGEFNLPPHDETMGLLVVASAQDASRLADEIHQIQTNQAVADELRDQKVSPEELKPRVIAPLLWLAGRSFNRVMNDEEARFYAEACEDSASLPELQAVLARREWDIKAQLELARDDFQHMTEGQATTFERYCELYVPETYKGVRQLSETQGSTWAQWWGRHANDVTLVNFLSWHVQTIHELQNSEPIREETARQKAEYQEGLATGIANGYLGSKAIAAIEAAKDIKIFLGDVFDTVLAGREGYHWYGTPEVVVAARLSGLRIAAKHELNHAVLGAFKARWLNEATTEHVARAMEEGEWDIIDPLKRSANGNYYRQERSLLNLLLEGGQEKIPTKLVTRAYASEKDSKEREELNKSLQHSWAHHAPEGSNPIDQLEWYIFDLEEAYMRQEASPAEAQRLAMRQAVLDFKQRPGYVLSKPDAVVVTLPISKFL